MLSAENLASIESEGRRLGLAVRRDPSRPVPQYPCWTLADLASHTASIHGRTILICQDLPEERISAPRLPQGADPVEWYEEIFEKMLAALIETDPAAEVWTLGSPSNIGFWERRMVVETGVHRWDAYQAFGEEDRLTDVVAVAGLEEFQTMWMRQLEDVGAIRVSATDLGVSHRFGVGEPKTEIEASASDIYLRLMSRPSPVEISEDWAAAVDGLAPTPKP